MRRGSCDDAMRKTERVGGFVCGWPLWNLKVSRGSPERTLVKWSFAPEDRLGEILADVPPTV
jgi:hypothetical protein